MKVLLQSRKEKNVMQIFWTNCLWSGYLPMALREINNLAKFRAIRCPKLLQDSKEERLSRASCYGTRNKDQLQPTWCKTAHQYISELQSDDDNNSSVSIQKVQHIPQSSPTSTKKLGYPISALNGLSYVSTCVQVYVCSAFLVGSLPLPLTQHCAAPQANCF